MGKRKSTTPKDRQSLVGIFLFLPIPIALTAVGCYFYVAAIDVGIDSEVTVGEVVSYEVRRDRDSPSRRPIVRYTVDDKTYRCYGAWISDSGGWIFLPDVGDRLPIRYKRLHPDQAVVDTIMDRWLGPLVALGVGLFFLIPMSAYIIRRMRKNPGGSTTSAS